ncbi:MAG: hypothetical protein ACTSRS_01615 [Candidatus Helarchaeota archaeon]
MSEETEEKVEFKKETEIGDTLANLNIKAIEGIDSKIASKLRTLQIRTIGDLANCNPFVAQAKLKLPIHKIMEYRKKAQMILRLRFNKEIINYLVAKNYTIQQVIEEDPKVLKKITRQDMEEILDFLDQLTQVTIFLDTNACRSNSVSILRSVKPIEEEPKPQLPEEEEKERFGKYLENTEIALLLERMLEGYIRELTPRWAITTKLGFSYPEAEEIISPSSEVTYNILAELYTVGILKRHFFDKIMRCPKCQFINLSLRLMCVRCGSRNLIRDEMIEHYNCAHVDLERRFIAGDALVCPKCGKELKQLGLDYSRPGKMYECRDCGDLTGSPYQRLLCLNCNHLMKREDPTLDDVWSFTLNEEKKNILIELLDPKHTIMNALLEKGFNFEVERLVEGKLKGTSGVLHFFDIYAEKDTDHLLIEFITDETVVVMSSIYDLVAKAQDLNATIVVLFAIPAASADVKQFAQYHNISVLEGENLAEILPVFQRNLSSILKLKFK